MHRGTYEFMEKEIASVKQKVKEAIYSTVCPLQITGYPSREPLRFDERMTVPSRAFQIGEKWGDVFDCCWFHFYAEPVLDEGEIRQLCAYLDLSGEALVVDETGAPIRGLTTFASVFDRKMGLPEKCVYPIPDFDGRRVEFWADAGCNDLFGNLQNNGTLLRAELVLENEQMRQLYYDIEVLQDLMNSLESSKARRYAILHSLFRAVCVMYDFTDDEAAQARKLLKKELEKKGGDASLYAHAIGHAHIDLAWTWPIRETKRKAARTFATAVENMKRYPDYRFIQSQPQAYAWVKEEYPSLYQSIRERVKAGQWEAEGGMWVEADTNLSGGEALVRQILYGKSFFRQEFGVENECLWLPDVFGYSGALPQIMKKSGLNYFMTIKLSWNFINKFPHHTFRWVGIDGSEVLAHMPPEGNYLSSALPHAVLEGEKSFAEKGASERFLIPFGIGDGGGGPGEEHLERLERQHNLEGSLPVRQTSVKEFFHLVEKEKAQFPSWKGELYLERHRGTYTTQAKSKRFNRKGEAAFRETEYICTMAMALCGRKYPKQELEALWKEFLLYQFHDILPGTSIDRVYVESHAGYEKILRTLEELRLGAADELGKRYCPYGNTMYFNTLPFRRVVGIENGNALSIPPLSAAFSSESTPREEVSVCGNVLENRFLKVVFDENGCLQSVFDKTQQWETLSACSNRFCLYADNDNAWEMPVVYRSRPPRTAVLKSREQKDGALIHTYEIGVSQIRQTVSLEGNQVRFDTEVDWQERHKMLRVVFNSAVQTDEAVCEIQFGSIRRSTRKNTGQDEQVVEVCAHKWLDLSDGNHGAALLNDCKYGYHTKEGNLDLCLLRATTHPGKHADIGKHQFTYVFYPHNGDYVEGNVVEKGYALHIPVTSAHGGQAEKTDPLPQLIGLSGEHIMIETVKAAEDGRGIIVRMYEYAGRSEKAKISSDVYQAAILCNLMEEDICVCEELEFHPFEIHTVRLI